MAQPKLLSSGQAQVASFNLGARQLFQGALLICRNGEQVLQFPSLCPQLAGMQDFHVEGDVEFIPVYSSLRTVNLKKSLSSLRSPVK